MAEIVKMPKMSDTMTEGVVSKWHKKVGDKVKTGDLLAEIETDKATMDFESYQEGTLLYIGVQEGNAVPVDATLAILGKEGEDYKPLLESEKAEKPESEKVGEEKKPAEEKPSEEKKPEQKETKAEEPKPSEEKKAPSTPQKKEVVVETVASDDGRLKASPLAKRLADEKGINLTKVKGSGEQGRIVKRDIDWYKPGMTVETQYFASSPGKESFDEIAVSQMRKTIAKRLVESKFSAPHFYLTMEIDMEKTVDAREIINSISDVKISFNDFVIKASAAALRQHPMVNSSWMGDKIRVNHHIHIGVAVAVEEGLLVPVVKFADEKTLSQVAEEVKILSGKAKDKKLQPSDWEGNTFTISNLGMFGIEEFTAIINSPDACILAVGAIKDTPVVKNGQVVPGKVMKVTLSCDHRVVDGATGSAFLKTLKGFLENPVLLLGAI